MPRIILAQIEELRRSYGNSRPAQRILCEMEYLAKRAFYDNVYHKEIGAAVERLQGCARRDGVITFEAVKAVEASLTQLGGWAKEQELLCVAHAHIDMNWQWGWHETVQLTLDTFQTVLDLMEQYPYFKFSQSQASCYKIVADYDEEMLKKIKGYVKEGRWEVSASTWVEGDRNLANGESMFRHFLYTRRYLSQLLDIEPETLNFDFEPDTFGHNANTPEILHKCGIQYYYLCRGYDAHGKGIFRWRAPGGSEVVAYSEPEWYMHTISGKIMSKAPEYCHVNGTSKYLIVYGVGDHGGGPTRRDIETIIEMQQWPLAPKISFASYRDYYAHIETVRERLPVICQELNCVFDGCYTTQSRIKLANRFGESALYEAELYNSLASQVAGLPYKTSRYFEAWRNVLFNHFHDILPGSGVVETREHALGQFQETMAIANTAKMKALRAIASKINTGGIWPSDDRGDGVAEGAGAGSGGRFWRMSQVERCDGKTRIYHVFNSLPFARREAVEFTVWDWIYDKNRLVCKDGCGKVLAHQLLKEKEPEHGHKCFKIVVDVNLPAGGYMTVVLGEQPQCPPQGAPDLNPRVIDWPEPVLENDLVRAEFDRFGMLISFIDKQSGAELLDKTNAGAGFLSGDECNHGYSAWAIWPVVDEQQLSETEPLNYLVGPVQQELHYRARFRNSELEYIVTLPRHSRRLEYTCTLDWRETGNSERIPYLRFNVPLAQETSEYCADIANGLIHRKAALHDVPALSFIAGGGAQLMTDCKYGFRGNKNALGVTLIHAAADPDKYPEHGLHRFRLALAATGDGERLSAESKAFSFRPDIISAYKKTGGELPLSGSFWQVSGGAMVSCVKQSENGAGWIVRLFNESGSELTTELTLPGEALEAYETDGHETAAGFGASIACAGSRLQIKLRPFMTHSIFVRLKAAGK